MPLVEALSTVNRISIYILQAKYIEVTSKGVRVEKDVRDEVIPADSVVFSIGQAAELEMVDKLRNCAPRVRAVGDCVEAKKIIQAIRTAFFSVMNVV